MLKKILAVLAASLFSVTAALAVDYSGKTVTMWIPFKAGGGSDTWARAIGPAFSANLPGNPTVVVKNVTDGKAIGASNKYFAEHGKDKDGKPKKKVTSSEVFMGILKEEGFFGLWRGVEAQLSKALLSSGLKFAIDESVKDVVKRTLVSLLVG